MSRLNVANFRHPDGTADNITLDSSTNATVAGNLTASGNSTVTGNLTVDGTGNQSIAGTLQFNSGYGSVATAYGVRAWVNWNGTGTVSIRDDGNVSSITDNGTGDYRINFTSAMPDTNYTALSGGSTTSDSSVCVLHFNPWNGSSPTAPNTSWIEVESRVSSNSALKDVDYGYVAIVR